MSPDENRFAGLSTAAEEDLDEAEETEPEPPSPEPIDPSPDEPDTDEDTAEADEEIEDEGGPAFESDETTQESVYVREETWKQAQGIKLDIERELTVEGDLDDLAAREIYDAILMEGLENQDAIRDRILSERS